MFWAHNITLLWSYSDIQDYILPIPRTAARGISPL